MAGVAQTRIPNIRLSNGVAMPMMGLGTWQLQGKECREAIRTAIDLGYKHIDTAEMYGNEKDIGDVIQEYDRRKLFITSKVSPWHLSHDAIIERCERSLSALGTGYVDLYLIHWPRPMNTESALSAFKQLYDEGKIRAFGVSNFEIRHLKHIMPAARKLGLPITVDQIEYHPLIDQKELVRFCHDNGIAVVAYSPLARCAVFGEPIITGLAAKYGRSPAEIVLRWIYQKGIASIPKASLKEHLEENMDIFGFRLVEDDVRRLDMISARKNIPVSF